MVCLGRRNQEKLQKRLLGLQPDMDQNDRLLAATPVDYGILLPTALCLGALTVHKILEPRPNSEKKGYLQY